MIEVSGLSKRYGDVHALHDITFKVEKGQVVGFLGANGAGKTTTMDILCGCIGADHGFAKVAGYDITENPFEAKKRLGYLPDEPPIYNEMRVEDFIRFSAKINGLSGAALKQAVDATVEKLSLGDVRRRVIANLSKGYRQRVAFAQAIAHDPEVLVLDEPTEGLDPNQIVQIRKLIRSLKGQHTIILSSHILSEVQATCDEIIIIHKGRVTQQGPYESLVGSDSLVQRYQLVVRQEAAELIKKMSAMPGLQDISYENETVSFGVSVSNQSLDAVLRLALDGGHGVQELTPKTVSLEDVFFSLTN